MQAVIQAPAESGSIRSKAQGVLGWGGGSARLLEGMLDVVDYGILLVLPDGHVAFANRIARCELDCSHPLAVQGDFLQVRDPLDLLPLRDALACAFYKGLQRMLTLHDEQGATVSLAIVPITDGSPVAVAAGAMLTLGKRKLCDDLSAEAFGRHHKLTAAEERVLKQLCSGRRPAEIARHQGVALSTVRTQIGCLREKTGASSIAALVHQLSKLPPMVKRVREPA